MSATGVAKAATSLVPAAGTLAGAVLLLSLTVLCIARHVLHLPLGELQTVVFLLRVFSGQRPVYLMREHGHFSAPRPSQWLAIASIVGVASVSALAMNGILMTAPAPTLVAGLLATVAVYLALLDLAKVCLFRAGHLG